MATATLVAADVHTVTAGGNHAPRKSGKGKPEKPDYMVVKGLAAYEPRLEDNGTPKLSKTGDPLQRYVVGTKLKEVPADYSFATFKPLTESCFESEETYLRSQLQYYEWRKSRIDTQIEETKNQIESFTRFSNEDERNRWNATQKAGETFAKKLSQLSAADKAMILQQLQQQLQTTVG